MTKEYRLWTIQDIFEQVPADRIGLCLDELKTLLVTNKRVIEGMKITAETLGTAMPETPFHFSNPIIWKDDGKGTLDAEYSVLSGERIFSTRIVRDPKHSE